MGGDLYDFFVTGDVLWFIVADAAGKGVSAALFMAVTRTLFRAVAGHDTSVGPVLAKLNVELARDNERQFFVTAVAGRLDPEMNRVHAWVKVERAASCDGSTRNSGRKPAS